MKRSCCVLLVLSVCVLICSAVWVTTKAHGAGFSGGGASLFLGTGYPDDIAAVTDLAQDLDLDDRSGNIVGGIHGFYQGDRYRLGAALQGHAWAHLDRETDDAAGAGAVVGGLYASYSLRRDRALLNVGGILGAGRAFIWFNDDNPAGGGEKDGHDDVESVSTFYLEPFLSGGVAASRHIGFEVRFSAPLFLFTEDLDLVEGDRTYTVRGSDLNGFAAAVMITFGRIAEP